MELLVHYGQQIVGYILQVPMLADLCPDIRNFIVRIHQIEITMVTFYPDKALFQRSFREFALLDGHDQASTLSSPNFVR
jgi:hypothetical protein